MLPQQAKNNQQKRLCTWGCMYVYPSRFLSILLLLFQSLWMGLIAQDNGADHSDSHNSSGTPSFPELVRESSANRIDRSKILQQQLQRTLLNLGTPPSEKPVQGEKLVPHPYSFRANSFAAPTTSPPQYVPQKRGEYIKQAYGVLLVPKRGRSFHDGKRIFQRGDYWLASEIIMESRYTAEALHDPYYPNWLLKSLLAARRLEYIPRYLKQYRLQREVLLQSKTKRNAELYYLIGRYHFAKGATRFARGLFVDYLYRFPEGEHTPNSYYWIARSLEREGYLKEARMVYLLVVSYYSYHYLTGLAEYKANTISLYLLKRQAEEFLRSRGVDWTM
ncbi:MAG: hypothetical protein AAF975_04715 [Spirochaetota bacterium]